MKFLISVLLSLSAMTAVAQPNGEGCSPVQINSGLAGNGFAISSDEIITVDHVIAPDAQTITIQQSGVTSSAKVVARSYRTDLALLKLTGSMRLEPCTFKTESPQALQKVLITGMHMLDHTVSPIVGSIINTETGKLMVPGINDGLEIAGAGLTRSFSGSPVTSGGVVIGIVSEKTVEGNVLAIRSHDITDFVKCAYTDSCPQKPYEYDYKQRAVVFSGLQIADPLWIDSNIVTAEGNPHGLRSAHGGQDGDKIPGNPHGGLHDDNGGTETLAGGNPHGLRDAKKNEASMGNPHGGMRDGNSDGIGLVAGNPHGKTNGNTGNGSYAVAGTPDSSTSVAATILNQEMLSEGQPQLGSLLDKDLHGTTILIRSIDGIPTPDFISLMRVLEYCRVCHIDSFAAETDNTRGVALDMARTQAVVIDLKNKIEENNPDLADELESYASLLLRLHNTLAATHAYDSRLVGSLFRQWDVIEKDLETDGLKADDKKFSDQADQMYEISKFNDVFKMKLRTAGWGF